jgi:hypothetical protein
MQQWAPLEGVLTKHTRYGAFLTDTNTHASIRAACPVHGAVGLLTPPAIQEAWHVLAGARVLEDPAPECGASLVELVGPHCGAGEENLHAISRGPFRVGFWLVVPQSGS